MQAKLKEVLDKAYRGHYAVGAFNTSDLEITQGIIEAAIEMNSPVIVQTSEKAIHYAGLEEISSIVRIEAIKAPIPVVLHLDHGKDLDLIGRAMKFGYSSVMVDTSVFSENKRIDILKKVVLEAHKYGVSVEGERDSIKGREDFIQADSSHLTDPDKAVEFVNKTGIDAFAVSIGNAHGGNLPGENLNLNLLHQIHEKIDLPLVLHGASSTPEEKIKEAVKYGISKINIDTDLRHAFALEIKELFKDHPETQDPREIMKAGKEAVKKVVKEKIKLFGSAGKA
ncbi:MAG: hypothetical protein A3F33_02140 [Candidatus Woykebacteria bacterium RIFCSPHIGHO2_12_FULL_43_10]|uniref:Fructose-1,6-bisphosphate aldolase, class II n=2 Tax=Candidatus Woykeibacteriota TaxID=1817899 RepID=A0A1G1WX49_9BACT|nr:MAG: hypothetical protein A2802_01060 [Candidatus Woykebacteria bacterium RIFCSPHIGHO2_01_FULL_43_29]OGY28611.1 MAG: hypothetical protein A3J50_02675 [Candidatus Woykebacteria bacterium RIFCSPHIGHO2_02_FULL_43_16b]OGY28763.1 MAG: hypothetical protein A3F33_02140 [Candidatus Woykebacteria bacterium RIFCSPHIGHO2_12_FULL_43_10]OGY32293.1 MAG: hypothetical protein A3A61_04375 [Candidatus Woykebacteria bacterium RIFCSPLOWO2_01_FULL_43_14]